MDHSLRVEFQDVGRIVKPYIQMMQDCSAGLADHMTISGSAEQLALELAAQIAQVTFTCPP